MAAGMSKGHEDVTVLVVLGAQAPEGVSLDEAVDKDFTLNGTLSGSVKSKRSLPMTDLRVQISKELDNVPMDFEYLGFHSHLVRWGRSKESCNFEAVSYKMPTIDGAFGKSASVEFNLWTEVEVVYVCYPLHISVAVRCGCPQSLFFSTFHAFQINTRCSFGDLQKAAARFFGVSLEHSKLSISQKDKMGDIPSLLNAFTTIQEDYMRERSMFTSTRPEDRSFYHSNSGVTVPVIELLTSSYHSCNFNVFNASPIVDSFMEDEKETEVAYITAIPCSILALYQPLEAVSNDQSLELYNLQHSAVTMLDDFTTWAIKRLTLNVENSVEEWKSSMSSFNSVFHGLQSIGSADSGVLGTETRMQASSAEIEDKGVSPAREYLLWLFFFHMATTGNQQRSPRISRDRLARALSRIMLDSKLDGLVPGENRVLHTLLQLNCPSSVTEYEFFSVLKMFIDSFPNKDDEKSQSLEELVIAFCQNLYDCIQSFSLNKINLCHQDNFRGETQVVRVPGGDELLRNGYLRHYTPYRGPLATLFSIVTKAVGLEASNAPPSSNRLRIPEGEWSSAKIVGDNVLVIEGDEEQSSGCGTNLGRRYPTGEVTTESLPNKLQTMSYCEYTSFLDCLGFDSLGISHREQYVAYVQAVLRHPQDEKNGTTFPRSNLTFDQLLHALSWLAVLMGRQQIMLNAEERVSLQLFNISETLRKHLDQRERENLTDENSKTFVNILDQETRILGAIKQLPHWGELSSATQTTFRSVFRSCATEQPSAKNMLLISRKLLNSLREYDPCLSTSVPLLPMDSPVVGLFHYWLRDVHMLEAFSSYRRVLVRAARALLNIKNLLLPQEIVHGELYDKVEMVFRECEQVRLENCRSNSQRGYIDSGVRRQDQGRETVYAAPDEANEVSPKTMDSHSFNFGNNADKSSEHHDVANVANHSSNTIPMSQPAKTSSLRSRSSFSSMYQKNEYGNTFSKQHTAVLQSLMKVFRCTPQSILHQVKTFLIDYMTGASRSLVPAICFIVDIVEVQCTWINLKALVLHLSRSEMQKEFTNQRFIDSDAISDGDIDRVNKLLVQLVIQYSMCHCNYIANDACLPLKLPAATLEELSSQFRGFYDIIEDMVAEVQEDNNALSTIFSTLVAGSHLSNRSSLSYMTKVRINPQEFRNCTSNARAIETAVDEVSSGRMALLPSSPLVFFRTAIKLSLSDEFFLRVREFRTSPEFRKLSDLVERYDSDGLQQRYEELFELSGSDLMHRESFAWSEASRRSSGTQDSTKKTFAQKIKEMISRSNKKELPQKEESADEPEVSHRRESMGALNTDSTASDLARSDHVRSAKECTSPSFREYRLTSIDEHATVGCWAKFKAMCKCSRSEPTVTSPMDYYPQRRNRRRYDSAALEAIR